MRIGVSGPGGVGKTTLCYYLSHCLQITHIREGVRSWLTQKSYYSPWLLSQKEQINLQYWFLGYKIRLETYNDFFVSDRTTLDAVVLSRLRSVSEEMKRSVTLLEYIATNHAKNAYDLILVLTANRVRLQPDGCRIQDKNLCIAEEEMIIELLKKLDVPFYVIQEPDNETILKLVLDHYKNTL